MNSMMECGGMMWSMMLFGVLGLVVLILLLAALIKYLFFSRSKPKDALPPDALR
jgi:hypothetical protein